MFLARVASLTLTLAFILLFAAPVAAQSGAIVLQGAGTIPLTFVDDRPVIAAYINGRGPFRFGLETGAPYRAIVAPSFAAAHGFAGGRAQGSRTVVDSLRAGDVLFRSFEIAVSGDIGIAGIDGMIGLAAFQDVLLTIDAPRGLVRVSRDTLPATAEPTIVPLRAVAGLVAVETLLGGTPTLLAIDTQGSGQSIACDPRITAALAFEGPTAVVGQAQIGVGNPAPVELRAGRLAADVQLGDIRVPRPIVSTLPLPDGIPCILGLSVLRQVRVAIDQRSMRARWQGPTALPRAPSLFSVGINIGTASDGLLRVRVVRPGSAADQAGVRVGDVVTHIAGVAATAANTSPAAIRTLAAAGRPFPLTIKRDDTARTVDLTPSVLVR